MWRRQGGDAGDASSALALLLVLLARLGTLRACSAGVLGGSRDAGAAGSSPATGYKRALSCASLALLDCYPAGIAAKLMTVQGQGRNMVSLDVEGNAGRFSGLRWALYVP